MTAKKKPKKKGRPTSYTPTIGTAICLRLIDGESLRAICLDKSMPARSRVIAWLAGVWDSEDPRADFRVQYARAREAQAELYAEEIVEIADDDSDDMIEVGTGKNAKVVPNGAKVQRDRLRMDGRKWVVERLMPQPKRVVVEGGDQPLSVEIDVRALARKVVYLFRLAQEKEPKVVENEP